MVVVFGGRQACSPRNARLDFWVMADVAFFGVLPVVVLRCVFCSYHLLFLLAFCSERPIDASIHRYRASLVVAGRAGSGRVPVRTCHGFRFVQSQYQAARFSRVVVLARVP